MGYRKASGCLIGALLCASVLLKGAAQQPPAQESPPAPLPQRPFVLGLATEVLPFEGRDRLKLPRGFDARFFKTLASDLPVSCKIFQADAPTLRTAFSDARIDAIADFHLPDKAGADELQSIPYLTIDYAIFTRQGSPVHHFDDIRNREILVIQGGVMEAFVRECALTDQITPRATGEAVLRDLAAGRGDCALLCRTQGHYLISLCRLDTINMLPMPFEERTVHLRVRPEWAALMPQLNQAIAVYLESPKFARHYRRWLAYTTPLLRINASLQMISIACLVLLGLLLLAAAWVWLLRRSILKQTQRLAAELDKEKHIERALHDSEERYRLLVEHQSDLILKIGNDFCVQFASPTVDAFFGVKSGYFIGRNIMAYLSPDEQKSVTAMLSQLGIPPHEAAFEHAVESPLGKRTLAWGVRALFDDDGALDSGVCVGRDISALRAAEENHLKLEKQVLQTQKLESLGILAGGIAHDFNNMLTTILGHADLCMQQMAPEERLEHNLVEIRTAAQRAAELCRQLLAYAGRGELEVALIELNRLVEEMADLLKVSISKRVDCVFTPAYRLPMIEGDASQIRQVVMNLITNASDALNERNGRIHIATSIHKLKTPQIIETPLRQELAPGTYVLLEVEDNGCGMSQETLQRIFDPFFTTKVKGRGLGLAAVFGVVRRLQGAIEVESTPEIGTKMRVFFPAIALTNDVRHTTAALDEAWRGQGRILLVDDEAPVLETAGMMLEHMGFGVSTAFNAAEAARLLENDPGYCCVLLDYSMPGMSAEEACRALRAINPEVPIVICSGYSRAEVRKRFNENAVADFMQKPYQIATMQRTLKKLVDGVSP